MFSKIKVAVAGSICTPLLFVITTNSIEHCCTLFTLLYTVYDRVETLLITLKSLINKSSDLNDPISWEWKRELFNDRYYYNSKALCDGSFLCRTKLLGVFYSETIAPINCRKSYKTFRMYQIKWICCWCKLVRVFRFSWLLQIGNETVFWNWITALHRFHVHGFLSNTV